jgi:integral membrane sensor domain MASE1
VASSPAGAGRQRLLRRRDAPSLKLASINPSATPIWPPTGLALASVILWGYRVSPAIYFAALFANVATAGSIHTSAVIAFGNTLECLVGGYLVNRCSGGIATFDTPADVTKFALICLAATPISATLGVGTLVAAGYADMAESLQILVTWWLGDLAGAVVVAPVIMLWSRAGLFSSAPRELWASAIIIAAACLVGIIAFSPLIAESATKNALGFLSVIPLLGAALRSRRADTATGPYPRRLRGVGCDSAGRAIRPQHPERFLPVASYVHDECFRAQPHPEHRRQRATRGRAASQAAIG